jgi:hypothetical protein
MTFRKGAKCDRPRLRGATKALGGIRLPLLASAVVGILLLGGAAALTSASAVPGTHSAARSNIAPSKAAAPSPRIAGGVAYDAKDDYMVLFGGSTVSPARTFKDTWTYASGKWTEIHPTTSPSSRGATAMTYDAADGYVLLFGGLGSTGDLGDTWTYHAKTWLQVSPITSPTVRVAPSVSYDPLLKEVVLFGGRNDGYYVADWDTWIFKGGVWKEINPKLIPTPRFFGWLVYDPSSSALVMFGGRTITSSGNEADVGGTVLFAHNKWT